MARKPRQDIQENNNVTNPQQSNQQNRTNNNQGFNGRNGQPNNQGFNGRNGQPNNQGFNGRNGQPNNQGFNNYQNEQRQNSDTFETQSDRRNNGNKSGSMSKIIIGVVAAVIVVGAGIWYFSSSSNNNKQEVQQQQKQQQAQVQQQQQQQTNQQEQAVMNIKTFNNKTSGFNSVDDMVTALKGKKVSASDQFSNVTGSTRFIEYTKGRVMLADGYMFCYITGEVSQDANNNMQNAIPFIQQIPYSIYENIPAQGAELAKVELDTDNSGNTIISWALPSVGITNTVQQIQQQQAQKQMQQQMKDINTQQEANLKVVNNS